MKKLYTSLPLVYKAMDESTETRPLERFLSIFDTVVEELEDVATKSSLLPFPMQCAEHKLDDVFNSYGFKFHKDMNVNQKRRVLKALPYIMASGGGNVALRSLAKEMFGSSASVSIEKPSYVEGMSTTDYRRLIVKLSLDGNNPVSAGVDVDLASDIYSFMANQFRPANYALILSQEIYYVEQKAPSTAIERINNLLAKKVDRIQINAMDFVVMSSGIIDVLNYNSHSEVLTRREEVDLSQEANVMVAI